MWNRRFSLDTLGNVHAADIAVDTSGNVLVTGSAYNGATHLYDLFVVKYSPSGTKLWQYVYNGASGIYDSGTAITCAVNGDVFVSGVTWPDLFDTDALTVRLNSSGTQQWLTTFDNVSLNDAAGTVHLDGSLVVITGFTQNTATAWAYFAARYNQSNGTLDSQRIIDEEGTEIEQVNAATMDADGNIYITGSLGSGSDGFDVRTVALDPDLVVLWTDTWNGGGDADDVGRSIAVDEDKNVMIVGYTTNGSDRDALLLQYNAGSLINTETYNGGEGNDEFTQMALGDGGNMMVAGYSTQKGNADFLSAYYANDGTLLWSETYNGLLNKDDKAQHISKGKGEEYVVSGSTRDPEDEDLETVLSIKYVMHDLVKPQDEAVTAPFVENRGQLLYTNNTPASNIRYYSRSTYPNLFLTDETAHFLFSHIDTLALTEDTIVRLDINFVNALPDRPSPAVGLERQSWFHNYYFTHIPGGRARTPLHNKVLFPNIYEYTDIMFGQGDDGNFIRFICKPGSDPDDLVMEFTGATAISVLPNGDLKVETILEDLILPAPEAMTVSSAGVETEITAWTPYYYTGLGGNQVKIITGSYDTGKTLIIRTGKDRESFAPLWWSTYYGGNTNDNQSAIEYDEAGDLYTCGRSQSPELIIGNEEIELMGSSDWTINKFKVDGSPLWFTNIGGGEGSDGEKFSNERAYDLSVGGNDLYVGGISDVEWDGDEMNPGAGLPNTDDVEIDDDFVLGTNLIRGLVVRLTSNTGIPTWATFFDDAGMKRGGILGVEALENGGVAVVGYSVNLGSSTWNSVDPGGDALQQDEGNMFIGVFDEAHSLVWSTKFGPSNEGNASSNLNAPTDIVEDGEGNLFVTGSVEDDELNLFPVAANSFLFSGGGDGFLAKFAPDRSLEFATYIGGSAHDYGTGVVCDPSTGNVIVVGTTESSMASGFPIVYSGNSSADDDALGGDSDLFLAKYSNDGTLIHCRYLGGSESDGTDDFFTGYDTNPVNCIAVDATGNIFITGNAGEDFPAIWPSPLQFWTFDENSGGQDAFVAAFAADLDLKYSTYLGGSASDYGSGIAVANINNKHVIAMAGRTFDNSNDYPASQEVPLSYLKSEFEVGNQNGIISVIRTNDLIYQTVHAEDTWLPMSFASLSPNPCVDVLTINIEHADLKKLQVQVYDMLGRQVKGISLQGNQDIWRIPVSGLEAGNYQIVLTTDLGSWSGKFVKLNK